MSCIPSSAPLYATGKPRAVFTITNAVWEFVLVRPGVPRSTVLDRMTHLYSDRGKKARFYTGRMIKSMIERGLLRCG